MNQITQNLKITLVAFLALTSLVACSSGGDSGSSPSPSPVSPSSKALTSCSKDVAGQSDMGMNLQVYSSNGAQNTNVIRVRFNSFPSNFSNNSSAIVFWAYGTDSSGNYTSLTQVPFALELYDGAGGFKLISGYVYSLTWQQLAQVAANNGVGNSNAASALQSITFRVNVSNAATSTILQASLYLGGIAASGTPDRSLPALMPIFHANPSVYLEGHNQTLANMHPFKASPNLSETDYTNMGQKLCF